MVEDIAMEEQEGGMIRTTTERNQDAEKQLKELEVEACCDFSRERKVCCRIFLRNLGHSLDFIDDEVRLKWVTIFVFSSLWDTMFDINRQTASSVSEWGGDWSQFLIFMFYMLGTIAFALSV